jgi:hypothetical protein
MSQNLISATFPAPEAVAVQQSLNEVKAKLNFLLSLQPKDVSSIIKTGNTFIPFVELANQTVIAHPEIMPGVFDKEEFMRDFNLFTSIRPILAQLHELTDGLEKTYYAVGSDALVSSLDVYGAVKQNKDKVPGLNITAEAMGAFFEKTKQKAVETAK